MAMRKVSCFLMMFGLLDMPKQSARNAVRSGGRANVILPLMATLAAAMLHEEIWLVRSTYFTLPNILSATADDVFSLRYHFEEGRGLLCQSVNKFSFTQLSWCLNP